MIEKGPSFSVLRGIVTLAMLFMPGGLCPAEPEAGTDAKPQPEYRVKAKILRSFASYVEWPESAFNGPRSPFVIGIFGADPFGSEIDEAVDGHRIGDRPMAVRRLRGFEEADECQIIFISRAERHRQAAILAGLEGRPILTVGETEWFIEDGGGIRLALGKNRDGKTKAHLEVNLKALREVGLDAKPRLRILAAEVRQ